MNFVTWKIEGGMRDFRVLKRFIYKRKDYEMNDILGKSRHPGDDEFNAVGPKQPAEFFRFGDLRIWESGSYCPSSSPERRDR